MHTHTDTHTHKHTEVEAFLPTHNQPQCVQHTSKTAQLNYEALNYTCCIPTRTLGGGGSVGWLRMVFDLIIYSLFWLWGNSCDFYGGKSPTPAAVPLCHRPADCVLKVISIFHSFIVHVQLRLQITQTQRHTHTHRGYAP